MLFLGQNRREIWDRKTYNGCLLVSLISFRAQFLTFENIHELQMSSVCESVFNLIIREVIVSRKHRTHIRSSLSGKEFE